MKTFKIVQSTWYFCPFRSSKSTHIASPPRQPPQFAHPHRRHPRQALGATRPHHVGNPTSGCRASRTLWVHIEKPSAHSTRNRADTADAWVGITLARRARRHQRGKHHGRREGQKRVSNEAKCQRNSHSRAIWRTFCCIILQIMCCLFKEYLSLRRA
jgi:hypothetical protein